MFIHNTMILVLKIED